MPTYTDTKTLLGDQGALDALVAHTLTILADSTVTTLRKNALLSQSALEELYLPNLATIGVDALKSCHNLKKAIIGTNLQTVCSVSGSSSAIVSTGHCVFFVPDSLVDSYRSASKWSDIAFRIMGVSHADEVFWDDSEITDSWSEILANVASGTAASRYHVGQYKTIDLYTEGIVTFRIVGINIDELASGSGTAQLTWLADHVLTTQCAFDNVSGCARWKNSVLRSWLETDILPLFPEAIRNAIKPVKKYTRAYTSSSDVETNDLTTDKLWIPSNRETTPFIASSVVRETQGPVYVIPFTQANCHGRKYVSGNGTPSLYLRTANSDTKITYIDAYSRTQTVTISGTRQFAIGFCT